MTYLPFLEELIEQVKDSINSKKIIVLLGEEGSGKRFLIRRILEKDKKLIIRIAFNFENKDETGVENFRKILRHVRSLSGITNHEEFINKASKDLPYLGNTLSHILEHIINRKVNKLSEFGAKRLNPEEKEILNRIINISQKESFILVLENFQWRNNSSDKIISVIAENITDRRIFKNEIKIVATISKSLDYSETLFERTDDIAIVHTRGLNEKEISLAFGRKIPKADLKLVTLLTDGNIELILQLSKILDRNMISNFESSIETSQVLQKEEKIELVSMIFSKMLEKIFGPRSETVSVLEIASIIGDVFSKLELSALTEKEYNYIEFQLKIASNGNIVINKMDAAQFIHPVVRQLFRRRLKSKRYEYHTKFAQCLKKIRPSEFLLRGYHHYESGDTKNAIVFYLLADYTSILAYNNLPDYIQSITTKLIDTLGLRKFHNQMVRAHDLYIHNEIINANNILESIDGTDSHNDLLYGYFIYFFAKIKLFYLFSTEEIKRVALDLSTAREKFIEMDEIYFALKIDILLIHIYGYKLSDIETSRNIERRFISLYSNLPFSDKSFRDLAYEYKRKSAIIWSPEISEKRLIECIRYYEDEESNMLEYYKSLNNCGAIQIYQGKFNEAFNNINKCLKLVEEYHYVDFPEIYKPINNFSIVTILKSFGTDDIIEKINEAICVLTSVSNSNGSRVVKMNLAILYSITGNVEKGIDILDSILSDIKKESYDNAFYLYHINLNMGVMQYLIKKKDSAIEHLQKAMELSKQAHERQDRYYSQRDRMLLQLINSEVIVPSDQLLNYFINRKKKYLGTTWHFVGLGYSFSELHFWST